MKRIVLAMATTLAVLFLLFSYRTSTIGPTTATGTATRAAHVVPSSPSTSAGSATAGAAPQRSPAPSVSAPVKVDGKLVQTGYGPIVVEITVINQKIADAQAITYPDAGGRTRSINSNALPILRIEALKAQGANIDGVSGATHTTDGYVSSLQSALDLAGLK